MHHLFQNENPFMPLPNIIESISIELDKINRYPELFPESLRNNLSLKLGVPSDMIMIGAGAAGIALTSLQTLSKANFNITYSWRNFEAYPLISNIVGAYTSTIPLRQDGTQDLDALINKAKQTDVIILCNPHNPTGEFIQSDILYSFITRIPKRTFIILDEAYIEYVTDFPLPVSVRWIEKFPNLIVIRSFSKAYGLAGMRIGYGIAHPDIAYRVNSLQLPFSVNSLSNAAALASLEATEELMYRVRYIASERRRIFSYLRNQGWNVLHSQTNFLWIHEPKKTALLEKLLRNENIIAKVYPDEGVRITLARPAVNPRPVRGCRKRRVLSVKICVLLLSADLL
ncbi:aminotransferase class I/II-fold pyridoxal phosphate-dependent enzyme [Photorhabdus kleinii]|uniref:aminotransferase class I/II-fold pyridoxal phosphate-dependent enzyme n=1 Tax=Photorhabdus kleinii TaxID=768034 RepID=UPI0021D4C104|nr:aminotransferase class I/II-fold pyridoxal phosphate-dependent enzyme [Photorhabdus kleinii]MCT8343905.1 aminotransferase class I/II-fold pyridoxal phosphate-dependent enzyme [Photorhabdus kleinii]